MALAPGSRLGPYEIVAQLGAGGMGEVYRARDTRLGRDVALKVLPQSFIREGDRLRRFEQEAQAVATLNHPNILGIYDVGQHDGAPFLITELLEGESLREKLEGGAVPQRWAIDCAVQISQGLAAAHGKGIVHRDLKPDNIFVTKGGGVKVLDFGLAKLTSKAGDGTSQADGPTMTSAHTAAGVVMGTASYMAPEQVRGEAADARSDIFAFGAVLYEMLAGKRAFRRDTPAETMTAVLREDPPELTELGRPISPALERTMRRCLEKDPEQRFQSAKDLSFALSSLSGTETSATARAAIAAAKTRKSPWMYVAVVALVVAAVLAALLLSRRGAPVEKIQFGVPVPGEVNHMALSPDGRMLAFSAVEETSGGPMLYVQRIGSPEATLVAETEGASFPFWSPDDNFVAFFANGKLLKVAVTGGKPQVLAKVSASRGGSWGRKNTIIYSPDATGVVWQVNADGGTPAPLTKPLVGKDESSHRWPVFLPDGEHFLFWAGNFANIADDRVSGIYFTSLAAKEKKLVMLVHSSLGYSDGHLFYADDKRQLVSVSFDPSSGAITGQPQLVAGTVGFQPSTYWAAFTASENGTVVYSQRAQASLSVLTWFDREGHELGKIGEPGIIANPTISPDGDRVAVDITDTKSNNVDVWIEGLKSGTSTRFTFEPAEDVVPLWSRDGKLLAYRTAVNPSTVFVKAATGVGIPKAVSKTDALTDIYPNAWSADGQQMLCTLVSGGRGYDLVVVSVATGEVKPFLVTPAAEVSAQISPDGKWVAYASNESGEWEIYMTTFPDASGKWQVSRGGGSEARWRGDGKEIFYKGPKGMLMAVPVNTEGTFSTGTPAALFPLGGRAPISATDRFTYDVTKDGKRFLVDRYVKSGDLLPLNIVLHAAE